MIADILALYDFLQKNADKYTTLGAIFNELGERTEGDEEVKVRRVPTQHENIWFYEVEPVEDYVFTPMPIVPCSIDYAKPERGLPNAHLFRFTPSDLHAFSSGGNPNLAVRFSVVGYKPSQLLDKLKVTTSSS